MSLLLGRWAIRIGVVESDVADRITPAIAPRVSRTIRDDETTFGASPQINISNSIFDNQLHDLHSTSTTFHQRISSHESRPSLESQPSLGVENAQDNKSRRGIHEHDSNPPHGVQTHGTPSSTYLAEIPHAASCTQSHHSCPSTPLDASCMTYEQDCHTLRPTPSNPPLLAPSGESLPPSTRSSQAIENPRLTQAAETPVIIGHGYLEPHVHQPQDQLATLIDSEGRDSIGYDIGAQAPGVVAVPDTARNHRLNDEISRSTKCPRGDKGELTVQPTTGEIHGVHDQRISAASENTSSNASLHHELGLSRESSSFITEVSRESGSAQGVHRESTNGFFSNSRNFVLQQPTMIDASHHNHIQSSRPSETLLWLKDYIMSGAEFDSSERDPPPRCHPNTRASIIERTTTWIKDPHREKNLLWVRGAAGVGKSAIVQTILESLPEELLGGSVFFSRPRGHNDPIRLFPSIAYQLAVRDTFYRDYLTGLMLQDPRSLKKSMKKQFYILFEEPFVRRKLRDGQNTLLIALDGLDECGGDIDQGITGQILSGGRSSESAQCEIVHLISSFVLQHPSAPLIWIIASRPEKYLQVLFRNENLSPNLLEEVIPVDSTEACKDVEIYLNSEFTRIRENYPDLMTMSPWPTSKDFSLITSKASGLFIFAEVVIRFIEDPNPIRQLRDVLAAISKVSTLKSKENPLAVLDAMYVEIVSRVPPDILEPAKRIICNIALLDDNRVKRSIACLGLICNALDIPKDIALTALRPLHSVLYFPEVHDVGATRPRFYHASSRDFLEDESRSHELSVKKYEVCDELLEGLSKLAEGELPREDSLPWPGKKSLRKLREGFQSLNEGIPDEVALSSSIKLFGVCLPISEGRPLTFWQNYNFAKAIRQDSYIGFRMRHLEGQRIRELKRDGIIFHKTLESLGINHEAISKCHTQPSGCGYLISLNEGLKGDLEGDTEQVHKAICDWVEVRPKRVVRVWGCEKYRRCVVIKTSEISNDVTYGSVVFVGF